MNSRDGFEWMMGFLSSFRTCTLTCVCVCVYLLCIHTYTCTCIFVEQLLQNHSDGCFNFQAVREETETQKAQVKSKVK